MTIEQLRSACHAEPFRPFVIRLADGRQIPVVPRDFMLTAPSGRTIIVAQPDDSFNVIDLPLVTDLEFKSDGKGSRKRRRKA